MFFHSLCLYAVVATITAASIENKECDKWKCKGPLRFYDALRCKPIYETEGSCCPVRYECPHLINQTRSDNKCFANGVEYDVLEQLRDEDKSDPCNTCWCRHPPGDEDGPAQWSCALVECPYDVFIRVKPGCYVEHDFSQCCGHKELCPKSDEDRFTCETDGKVYHEGERFTPKNNPDLNCQCKKGYKGKNIEPFCYPATCGVFFDSKTSYEKTLNNCVPVYTKSQSPRTDCWINDYHCPNGNETVIRNPKVDSKHVLDEKMTCKFGNTTMGVGDKFLHSSGENTSECVKCTCETPPMPTCVQCQ